MEITPCLGIGDILVLKMREIANQWNLKKIKISRPLIRTYRQYPERYLDFVQRLLKAVFPTVEIAIVDAPHDPNLNYYPVKDRYIYDQIRLASRQKPPQLDQYLVFHTKVRMESMTHFVNHDLPLLRHFFANFKAPYNQQIVIVGERVIERCLEQQNHDISSIYRELLLLRYHNHVIDLTKEILYSGNPSYEDFEDDLNIIHHANLNVTFGIGGNMNMSYAFSHKNVSFHGSMDCFKEVFPTYPNAHQTVEPFIAQLTSMANQVSPLIILVMACATIPKYRNYLDKIEATWAVRCRQLGVKVLYFLGEEPTDLVGEQYIYLKGVGNDYQSASVKQNLGLQYIYDHYNCQYVYCCGSDTYVNIDKLLSLLHKYDLGSRNPPERLLIGGHLIARQTTQRSLLGFSGGGGFVVSRPLIGAIYHELNQMFEHWCQLCHQEGVSYLVPSCDVCLGYYAKQYQGHMICYQDRFAGCNYRGQPDCCLDKAKPCRLITCHDMSLSDFDQLGQILADHNYFINQPDYPRITVPNCTIVTIVTSVTYCQLKENLLDLMMTPAMMVIYCPTELMESLVKARDKYGNSYLTVFYSMTHGENTRSDSDPSLSPIPNQTKYQLMLRTLQINPFETDKFMWVDADLSITPQQLLTIAETVTHQFHYYITHLISDFSSQSHFGYSVSTQLFTCGIETGRVILSELQKDTGDTDDRRHTLVIEKYHDQVVKSHGSAPLIISNFLQPMTGLTYLYETILDRYRYYQSYQDVCHICEQIVQLKDRYMIQLEPHLWLKILFIYYVSAYYYQPPIALELVQRIETWKAENHLFEKAYRANQAFYDQQLSYSKNLTQI